MKRAPITHDESIRQNLAGWCFEVDSEYEKYSVEAAKKFIEYIGQAPVVDLGSGDGAATKVFVANGNPTTAVDINSLKLSKIKKASKVKADFVNYLREPVDNVFMHHSLEHYVDPQTVLGLISQNLKPGCYCYIAVPMGDNVHSVHHVAFDDIGEIAPPDLEIIEANTVTGEWPEYSLIAYKRPTMKDTPWAHEILEEGAKLLKKTKQTWWLECGALLGIYREGKLLDHDDPDIDITVLEPANHDLIRDTFINSGYEVFAEGSHQVVLKKRDVLFDISYYHLQGDNLVMEIFGAGKAVQPYGLFNPLGKIKFKGNFYPTTNNIEAYLEQRYGDWRTPKDKKKPWTEPGETLVWQPE